MREVLMVAEAVAKEKGIQKEDVLNAMKEAIQKAARTKYGHDHDVRAEVDEKTGEVKLYLYQEVVADYDSLEDPDKQVTLEEAQVEKADAKVGDFITEELPPIEFGRIAAQTAKQVITQKVREAERAKQYNEYKDRVGEIINGTVKRVDYGNVTVDLGKAEAVLRREDSIPREHFKTGDRVRAYIYDVREEIKGPQIFLSRTCPEFLAGLLKQEVPEIYDGIIEIKAIARDAGSRAKVAVISNDSSIDPVGACVGMRGSRIQTLVTELQGEKIDLMVWENDIANYIIKALSPAKISKVIVDEEVGEVDVVASEDQLSLAIGRRGQNVRLAAEITGVKINLMSEVEEEEKAKEEMEKALSVIMEALDIDDVFARLLIAEDFADLEDIAYCDVAELLEIEGLDGDETLANELQSRAKAYLEAKEEKLNTEINNLNVADSLREVEELDLEDLVALGTAGVKTLDDLADLAGDELIEIIGEDKLSLSDANEIIMEARKSWFEEK
ncbi:MAG: transcription termination factor NusA [Alphaproteobacteria bacterium]|jgi:N utilization substance protein A|nr:transcription termination factor NusA [Alphaproteobacteria bacterium]